MHAFPFPRLKILLKIFCCFCFLFFWDKRPTANANTLKPGKKTRPLRGEARPLGRETNGMSFEMHVKMRKCGHAVIVERNMLEKIWRFRSPYRERKVETQLLIYLYFIFSDNLGNKLNMPVDQCQRANKVEPGFGVIQTVSNFWLDPLGNIKPYFITANYYYYDI